MEIDLFVRTKMPIPEFTGNTIVVGTGSGSLDISQASTGAVNGDKILIRAGTYTGTVYIHDFNLLSGQRVWIKNQGTVIINGAQIILEDLDGVTIAGDNVNGLTYGFVQQNVTGRGTKLLGRYNEVMLKSMKWKNISDICIIAEFSDMDGHDDAGENYEGTYNTRRNNLKFINLDFEDADGIHLGGYIGFDTGHWFGHIQNLEMAYCNFHDTPDSGTFLEADSCDGWNIHHNRWTDVANNVTNHNGICFMTGSGDFHHNYLNEYHGDSIRAWILSFGVIRQTSRIYCNIGAHTKKYSFCEFQAFERFFSEGLTLAGDGEVFNNTVYNMNYEEFTYGGVILDTYNLYGGTSKAWNNVIVKVNYKGLGGTSFFWENGQPVEYNNPPQTPYESNRYYPTLADAGLSDDGLFNVLDDSPLIDNFNYKPDKYDVPDFDGIRRDNTQRTIGARQYQA